MVVEEGFARLGEVFSRERVEEARGEIARLLADSKNFFGYFHEPLAPTAIRKITQFCRYSEPLRQMSDRCAEIASELLAEPADMIVDNALLKPPLVGSAQRWHQDQAILDVSPQETIYGFWIALEEADKGNGCMEVFPRTNSTCYPHRKEGGWFIPDEYLPQTEPLALPMAPGEVAVWDGKTIHGSGPNRSTRSRWALQFHYKPVRAGNEDRGGRTAAFSESYRKAAV